MCVCTQWGTEVLAANMKSGTGRRTRGRGRKGSMHCSTIERSARCSCCCSGSCCVVVVAVAVAQHALVNYTLICCVKCLFNGSRCRHVFHTFIHSSRSTCSTQKCPLCLLLPSPSSSSLSECRPLFSMQQHFV